MQLPQESSARRVYMRKLEMSAAGFRGLVLSVLLALSVPACSSSQTAMSGSSSHGVASWPGRLPGALGTGAALLLVGGGIVLRRRRSRPDAGIPLIIDLEALSKARPAEPRDRMPASPPQESPAVVPSPRANEREGTVPESPAPVRQESAAPASPPLGEQTAAAGRPREERAVIRPASEAARPAAPDISLNSGTEEALQLLPGGLEILSGAEGPAAIRFFRSAALEVPEITLGRSHGAPYRHIHLWAPSVSRLHARLRFEGGRWKISNLSRTNPIRVNDLVFDAPDSVCTLSDGDHIQLGEVVLRYRESRS